MQDVNVEKRVLRLSFVQSYQKSQRVKKTPVIE